MQGSLMLDIAGLWLSAEDRELLRQPQVSGLILFARNIEEPRQLQELCRSIKALRPELLIAVDQEGGRVQRMRRGFTKLPSMAAIAASADPEQMARQAGWLMATEVLQAGVDFSFAPVLDLDYGHNDVIANRAFGRQPQLVTQLGREFIRGMRQAGMACVGKHFPGHGWVTADSHFAIPVDERSLEEITASDLQPFAQLAEQLDAVMPAHVIYPKVCQQPAGFSKFWLQDILRGKLGFTGLIFSDDLCMAGAHVAGDMAARTQAALAAGCDIALVCNDRPLALQSLAWLQDNKIAPCTKLASMQAAPSGASNLFDNPQYLAIRKTVSGIAD